MITYLTPEQYPRTGTLGLIFPPYSDYLISRYVSTVMAKRSYKEFCSEWAPYPDYLEIRDFTSAQIALYCGWSFPLFYPLDKLVGMMQVYYYDMESIEAMMSIESHYSICVDYNGDTDYITFIRDIYAKLQRSKDVSYESDHAL